MRTLITALCSLIACSVASSQQTAGMIAGTVVDDDGRAIARAIVRFAKLAEYSRDNQGKARLVDVGFHGGGGERQRRRDLPHSGPAKRTL